MEITPAIFIPQFTQMLQDWVDASFPLPRAENETALLDATVWSPLMYALCNRKSQLLTPFLHEMGQLRRSGRAGDPPNQAIESRLIELVEVGLRPIFIVMAARLVMDVSIRQYYPDALPLWLKLADEFAPLSDITRDNEMRHGGGTVYGPGIDD